MVELVRGLLSLLRFWVASRRLWAVRVGLAVAVVCLGVLLVTRSTGTENESGTWTADAALQVTAASLDGDGLPESVSLAWPASSEAVDNYIVRRGAGVVATLPSTSLTFTDTTPVAGSTHEYTVSAEVGGSLKATLGSPNVRFPANVSCTLLWTGGKSSVWSDAANWAPYGKAGLEGPVRAPTTTDQVCVDVTRRLPITVTDAGNVAGAIDGALFNPVTLRVEGGDLKVFGESTIPALAMAGGTLLLADDTELWRAAGRDPLTLGGGVLQIGTVVRTVNPALGTISGDVGVVSATTTTVEGGEIRTMMLNASGGASREVIGRGGHVLRVAASVKSGDGLTMSVGPGGASIVASPVGIEHLNGTATIDWQVGYEAGSDGLRVVVDGDRLTLSDLADVDVGLGDADTDVSSFELFGKLVLAEDVRSLSGEVYIGNEDAALLSGGDTQSFEHVEYVENLRLIAPVVVRVAGDLTVAALQMADGADLGVAGELFLIGGDDLEARYHSMSGFGGTTKLRVGEPSVVPEHAVLTLGGDVEIFGDITIRGTLDTGGNGGESFYSVFVTFHDDLTLESTATVEVFLRSLESDGQSRVVVLGRLTIAGRLLAWIGADEFPVDTDVLIIDAVDNTGEFDEIEFVGDDVDGDATGWAATVEDDGVHLEGGGGSGGGPTCDAVPDVNGMEAAGCWVSLGGEQWYSSDEVIPKPAENPTLGGLTFDPQVDVTLYLDNSDPRLPLLYALDSDDDVGGVRVTTIVTPVGESPESIDLGIIRLDWVLDGSVLDLDPTAFLGQRLSGGATVTSDEGPWQLSVRTRLPAAFGGVVLNHSQELTDAGLTDVSLSGVNIPFAGVSPIEGALVEYGGEGLWRVDKAGPVSIDAAFRMDEGAVISGSMSASGLSAVGMALPNLVLDYAQATNSWVSRTLAPDGTAAAVLVEAVSTTVGTGSRIVTTAVDFAVAAAPDGLELERVVGGWAFDGQVERNGVAIDVSSPELFQFSNGLANGGAILMEGSYGAFGVLEDLVLTTSDLVIDGVDRAATVFEITADMAANGGSIVVNGTLALVDSTVAHLEVPVNLALGELGAIEGVLRNNLIGVVEFVGLAPGTKPTYTCTDTAGTREIPLDVVSGLSGGTPIAPVVLPEVCFGPWTLRDVTVEPAVQPGTVDISGSLGGGPVTGSWEMDGGDLTKGTLDLPSSDIGGWLPVPAMSLDVADAVGTDRFVLADAALPGAPLRGFSLGFLDGEISLGDIDLGDIAPALPDLADVVADAGEWLPVGGVSIDYDVARDMWTLNGFLEQPNVMFDAALVLSDGKLISGSVDMNIVDLGPLGRVDVRLNVTGPSSFAVVGLWQGAEFADDRTVGGSLTFADGELVAGSLQVDELPIGELFVIDDLAVAFEAGGKWKLDGLLRTDSDEIAVGGALTFNEGSVTSLRFDVAGMPLGSFVLDQFHLELDRTKGAEWFDIGGAVRGPAETSSGTPAVELVEFEGSAEWRDGRLERFELEVPVLEIPGVAYLRDLAVDYSNSTPARLNAAGTVVTADETAASTAQFGGAFEDGRMLTARVSAQHVSLGGFIAIDDFELLYERDASVTCTGPANRDASTLLLSGETSEGTAVTGCLSFAGRNLVAGELDIEQLRIGDLMVVDDFEARFASSALYPAQWQQANPPAAPALSRARFDVAAVVTVGDLAPSAVSGAIELTDGGLSLFELAVPRMAVSSTVELHDLTIAYAQPSRWDGVSDTSFSIAGTAVHDGGETAAGGSLTFGADGQLEAARLSVSNLPLGPVTLNSFEFVYDGGAETLWRIEGVVETPDGQEFALIGEATLDEGRLEAASLTIPRLSVGELVLLTKVELSFERDDDDSERWFGAADVSGLGQSNDPSTALFEVIIDANGALKKGRIEVSEVRWGGLFTVKDLVLAGDRVNATTFVWSLDAKLSIGDGGQTSVSGQLELRDGVVHTGALSLQDVQVGELLVVDLDLSTDTGGGSAVWSAALSVFAVDSGTTTTGSGTLQWSDGRLDVALLQLGTIPVGELFTLNSAKIEFESGRRWALSATITDDDGTASASGSLIFLDGRWASGSLELSNLQVGPLDLQQLLLTVDSTGVLAANACGVADPGGSGIRFGVQASVRTGDGDVTSIGGRFRLDDGRFVEGVLCGDNIQFADMVVLDDVLLNYSQTGAGANREITFDGAATLTDVDNPSESASASVGFDIRDGQLQRLDLTADGLNLGNMVSLAEVELRFDRGVDASAWAFGGTLERSGAANTRLEGDLEIVDGAIAAGSLAAANLPVGDLFTFVNLQIDFQGRRSVPDAAESTAGVLAGNTTDCAATPNDSNVPVGVGGTTGTGARFGVSAQIQANDETFAVAGSLDFANGRLTQFDVSVACVPIGDFKTIEGLRIAYRGDMFIARGRLKDPDGTTVVAAELIFDAGRLTGGHLLLNDVPLGAVKVDEFDLALGENATGDTTFAISVAVERRDGSTVGGGGSLTLRDGRIMAGSITIDELPFMELFTLEDFEITFDNTVAGAARFAGEARVVVGGGPSVGIDISLIHEDGRLVGGSFAMEAIKLFDAVPLAGFSIAYDGSLSPPQWSGSFAIGFAGNDSGSGAGAPLPSIKAGVEFRGGRLISALIGFDGNGDGVVDGGGEGAAPTTGGGGGFSGLPLKGMYLKFCSDDAVSAYCEDVIGGNVWEGRLSFELMTETSPGLDAFLRIVDGRLSEASFEISGLNIPIYAGVFLQSIRGNIAVYPRFAIGGGLGITIGPSIATIVAIDGYLEVSEQPDPAPGSDPADYESEWIRIYTEGSANFFNLPFGLFAYGQIDTNGSVAFGGGIRLDIVDGVLYVNGEGGGALFNAEAMGLVNPRTGDPINGVAAQLYGLVEARILGHEIASARFFANTIGAAGCAKLNLLVTEVSAGAGIYWSDGDTVLTCDMSRFEIAGIDIGPVGSGLDSAGFAGRRTEARPSAEFSTFEVAPGEPVLGVHVTGVGGSPDVSLISPNGTVYAADDGDPANGSLVATSPDARWFLIGQPAAGTWRIQAATSSLPLDEVTVSVKLPPVDVAATITPAGRDVKVDWTAAAIPGQQIAFVERSLVGGDDVTAGVGSAAGGSGSFTFSPSGPIGGEVRELVAIVMQDGLTRTEVVLGTFTAPDAAVAGAPQAATVTEVPGGALVTWARPLDDGGRAITAYRLSASSGWSLSTDADIFSATLPIPALYPGKQVPVWVQAHTGAGWGAATTVMFTATQTTGLEATSNARIESTPAAVAADTTAPKVSVEQGSLQADPTSGTPIVFDVMFSEAVTGFDSSDVLLGGSTGASSVKVIGSGGIYRVIISGMTVPDNVTVSVRAAAAVDAAGNGNGASTSVDNSVQFTVATLPPTTPPSTPPPFAPGRLPATGQNSLDVVAFWLFVTTLGAILWRRSRRDRHRRVNVHD